MVEYLDAKKNLLLIPRSVQSNVYEDVRENQRFAGTWTKTINVDCQNGCALFCNRDATCRSFTCCGRNTCFLHRDDIFSTEEEEASLSSSFGCRYFAMERSDSPTCKEGETFIKIQEDNHQGYCQISSKRVDGEWTIWEHTEDRIEDSSTEFKNVSIFTREMRILEAHGGEEGNDSRTKKDVVTYHIKFVKKYLSVWDARANCENLQGELFEDLDGTQEQLDWLFEKMEGELFWLGINTEDHKVWKTFGDEVISEDKLLWLPGQPNNYKGEQFHVSGGGPFGPVLEDYAGSDIYYSVCRII